MAIMQFFSRQRQKKQSKDQHVALESLTQENETKAEVLLRSLTTVEPTFQNESKRRWSRQLSSHTCNEDNFFNDQFHDHFR